MSQLLDVLVDLAPPPRGALDVDGARRATESPFCAFVFKVQAGMDSAHRDRIAFVRVCSGTFERGDGRSPTPPPASRSPPSTRSRCSASNARPWTPRSRATSSGWSTPLRCARATRCIAMTRCSIPPIPSFAPEHFAVARGADPSKHKQFRRGIEQLEQEGVVQVLRSDRRGDQAPVLAAVGPMQFEVAVHRMATEFGAPISLESLPYQVARIVDPADAEFMDRQVSAEVLTRTDGVMLVLFSTRWRLEGFQRDNPDVKLGSLVAAEG